MDLNKMEQSSMELYHNIATVSSAITAKGYAITFIQRHSSDQPLIRVSHRDRLVTITMEGAIMNQETLVRLKRALALGCRP